MNQQAVPITDSPWFWVLVFSLDGPAALWWRSAASMARRQANIERQYQARERVAEKLAAENNPAAAERIDDPEPGVRIATPGDKLIPIWPLAALLGLISVVAAAMLYRGPAGSAWTARLARS